MAEPLDLETLKRLATDEDFLNDLARSQEPHSKDEFYDREFNRGLNAARVALIERLSPAAILAALERAERVEAAARIVAYADMRVCALCDPDRFHEHSADCPVMALRAALAPASEGGEPASDDIAIRSVGRFVLERHRAGWKVEFERDGAYERMVFPAPASGEEGSNAAH